MMEAEERLRRSSSPSPSPSADDTLDQQEDQCNGVDDAGSVESSPREVFYVFSDYKAVEDNQVAVELASYSLLCTYKLLCMGIINTVTELIGVCWIGAALSAKLSAC